MASLVIEGLWADWASDQRGGKKNSSAFFGLWFSISYKRHQRSRKLKLTLHNIGERSFYETQTRYANSHTPSWWGSWAVGWTYNLEPLHTGFLSWKIAAQSLRSDCDYIWTRSSVAPGGSSDTPLSAKNEALEPGSLHNQAYRYSIGYCIWITWIDFTSSRPVDQTFTQSI